MTIERRTDEEKEIVRELKALCLPTEIVSHIMRRSFSSILNVMTKTNIKSTYLPRWSKKEVNILLKEKAKGTTNKEISLKLGRTCGAVKFKWHYLNVSK